MRDGEREIQTEAESQRQKENTLDWRDTENIDY